MAIKNNEDRKNTCGGRSCNQIIVDGWVPQKNHGAAGAPKATDSVMQSGNWQQRGMQMAAGGWAVTEGSGAILILEGYKSSFFSARHFGCSLVSTGLLPDPTRSV